MYQNFVKVIENANVIIATYEDEAMGESQQVNPVNGTVAFGAGLFGWGFTIQKFARTYAKKFKIPVEKMVEKLWGDNFFDAKAKKWRKQGVDDDGQPL